MLRYRGEDYLEAIYNLSADSDHAHSVDVAKILGVTKPTAFKALQKLSVQGYINKENYGSIGLTVKGRKTAEEIIRKHQAVRMLLTDVLKVSPETAEADACKIEHCISRETTKKLFEFLDNKF